MTDAGWASDRQAEELADKIAVKAVGNVLGGHKLTCDEHENLQQDFKDGALEAYHQGRVASDESTVTAECIRDTLREQGNVLSPHVVAQCIDDLLTRLTALQRGRGGMSDENEDVYETDTCPSCDDEGFVVGGCVEDTCCCSDPELEHEWIPCPTCNQAGAP